MESSLNTDRFKTMITAYKNSTHFRVGQLVKTPAEGTGLVVGTEILFCKSKLPEPKIKVWCGKMIGLKPVIYSYTANELIVKS